LCRDQRVLPPDRDRARRALARQGIRRAQRARSAAPARVAADAGAQERPAVSGRLRRRDGSPGRHRRVARLRAAHRALHAAARHPVRPCRRRHGVAGAAQARRGARRRGLRDVYRARAGRAAARDAQYRRRVREPRRGQRHERQVDHEQDHGVHGARQADRAVRSGRGPRVGAGGLALRAAQRPDRHGAQAGCAPRRCRPARAHGRCRVGTRAERAGLGARGAATARGLRRALQMRYVALAAGFDGTLARDGRCDERCIEALRALAATGRKLILVTGRELRELLEIFPEARLFDYVVAENGAVMHRPATRESEILAQAPPEILLQELRRRHVTPLTVGSSIVRTVQANEAEVSAALRKLQLDFQLVTNPGALMMLPAGVNKASGVWAALRELGVSRHNLVAIGDGENDLALFEFAEHAVAVQNADSLVKRVAKRTTQGAYCEGFLELARDLIATDLAGAVPRHKVIIGTRENGAAVEITPCKDSLLVHGPDGSGKAALCNR